MFVRLAEWYENLSDNVHKTILPNGRLAGFKPTIG